jgi:hypothetical protein
LQFAQFLATAYQKRILFLFYLERWKKLQPPGEYQNEGDYQVYKKIRFRSNAEIRNQVKEENRQKAIRNLGIENNAAYFVSDYQSMFFVKAGYEKYDYPNYEKNGKGRQVGKKQPVVWNCRIAQKKHQP